MKCLRRLRNSARWDNLFTTKLGSLLHSRDYPLPVLGLEAIDPWFEGVSASPWLLRSLIANFCTDLLSVVKIDGIEYIARITPEDWDYALFTKRTRFSHPRRDRIGPKSIAGP